MSRNAIATGATPLSESDENPPASPILAKLPTADDDNARPCKRQRTAESGPEEAAEWVVHHGSEDDVVALAAQFEAEFLAAFQRTDCDTAHDDKTSAVGEEGPEATTLADELKRSRSPSHHDVNQAPLEPYDSLCHADSGVVQPKAPEQATRATSRVTNSAHKVPAHSRVPSPRPEGADGETAYGEEAATGEAMDVDEPEDTEMDDGASVTSQLSAGFYKDFMHDIAIDLENLLDNFQCPTPTPDASNEYSDPRLENGFSREEARDLRHTLRKWLEVDKSCRPNNLIYHRLDDIYKEINLDASTLVSRDQALVKTLLQLVEEIPVEIFLATLDRGIFYHSPDQWIIARKLLDMDGRLIVREVPVESNLLSPETLPNGDAYKNSRPGDPADPPRFETALVVVARDSVAEFLIRHSEHPQLHLPYLIAHYATLCRDSTKRDRLLPVLKSLCQEVWSKDPTKDLCLFQQFEDIYRSFLSIGDCEFFELAAGHTHGCLPIHFFAWARNEVISGRIAFHNIEKGISAIILSYPTVRQRCVALSAFVKPSSNTETPSSNSEKPLRNNELPSNDNIIPPIANETSPITGNLPPSHNETHPSDETRAWAQQHISHIAMEITVEDICSEGGEFLASALLEWLNFEPASRLLEIVLRKTASQTPFVLGIIRSLRQHLSELPSPAGKQLMEKLARQVVDAMEPTRLSSRGAASEPTTGTSTRPNGLLRRQNVLPEHLVSFIECLVAEKLDDRLMMRLAFKIVVDCDVIDPHELLSLWAPFVQLLKAAQERCNSPSLTRRFLHIADAVIETAYVRFLGHKPRPLFFPQQKSVTCRCKICCQLNVFLAGDAEEVEIPAESTDYAHIVCFLGGFWLKAIACSLERKPDSVVFRKLVTYAGGISKKTWLERSAQLRDALGGLDQDKASKMQMLMEKPEAGGRDTVDQDGSTNQNPLQHLATPGSEARSSTTGRTQTRNPPPTTFQVYTPPPPLNPPEIKEQARKRFFDKQTQLRQWNRWSSNEKKSSSAAYKAIQREWDTNFALQDKYMARVVQKDEARRQLPTTVITNAGKATVFDTDRYYRQPAPTHKHHAAKAATRSILPPPNRLPTPPRVRMPLAVPVSPPDRPLASTTRAATRSVLPPPNRPPTPPRIGMPLGTSLPTLPPLHGIPHSPSILPPLTTTWATTFSALPPHNRGPGFDAFVAELEPRLQKTAASACDSAAAVRDVLGRRWDAMTPRQRQGYVDIMSSKKSTSVSTPRSAVDLTATPAPPKSTERTSPPVKRDPGTPAAGSILSFNKRKTPGSGRMMQDTWRGWRSGPPSSPSSRTLTPVSGNRVTTPQTQTGSSQGLKRKQPIVIDLTLDD